MNMLPSSPRAFGDEGPNEPSAVPIAQLEPVRTALLVTTTWQSPFLTGCYIR